VLDLGREPVRLDLATDVGEMLTGRLGGEKAGHDVLLCSLI
jgi:hypothetical protein